MARVYEQRGAGSTSRLPTHPSTCLPPTQMNTGFIDGGRLDADSIASPDGIHVAAGEAGGVTAVHALDQPSCGAKNLYAS